MKNNMSAYTENAKVLMKALIDRLGKSYPYVSILMQDSRSMRLSVSKSGINAGEDSLFTKRGFVARVHNGKGLSEFSFNDLSNETLPFLVSSISACADSAKGEDPVPTDEVYEGEYFSPFLTDPDEMGTGEILSRLGEMRSGMLDRNEKLLDAILAFSWQRSRKLFMSKNRCMYQDILWSNSTALALTSDGNEVKECYKPFSGLCGAELLDEMNAETLDEVARVSCELLDSQPIPPGEYDCICSPDTTGMIVHEAFGHGVEMDMFVKDRALAREYVGKRVASPLVNMHDSACAVSQCASFLFDDEGVLAKDNLVIKEGILLNGYADSVSASRLGISPTGNGRRESFARKAYTRMTNTYFEAGNDELEDMIASVSYGFLLEDPTSGMEDPKNWGIQCMVNIAREIKDGKLTGKIFSPIVLTGYVPDLLKSISMVSKQVVLSGSGFCGKGHKEWVKVSDGGPYIKARVRLG